MSDEPRGGDQIPEVDGASLQTFMIDVTDRIRELEHYFTHHGISTHPVTVEEASNPVVRSFFLRFFFCLSVYRECYHTGDVQIDLVEQVFSRFENVLENLLDKYEGLSWPGHIKICFMLNDYLERFFKYFTKTSEARLLSLSAQQVLQRIILEMMESQRQLTLQLLNVQ